MRTCAAIIVHSGAEGKMCVRVRACNTFLVPTCVDVCGRAVCGRAVHVRTSLKSLKSMKISKRKRKKFEISPSAGTKTAVRVRAPHTIKMCAMCVRVRPKNRAH